MPSVDSWHKKQFVIEKNQIVENSFVWFFLYILLLFKSILINLSEPQILINKQRNRYVFSQPNLLHADLQNKINIMKKNKKRLKQIKINKIDIYFNY